MVIKTGKIMGRKRTVRLQRLLRKEGEAFNLLEDFY